MKYKNLLLTLTAFLLAVFYALFKRAPTIQQSLIRDGYKLVSNSQNKKEIYESILERNKADINLIVLDQYLINEKRQWEALSFWCDLNTNKNSFFRDLNPFQKFCVMAIADVALIERNKELVPSFSKLVLEKKLSFVEKFMQREKDKSLKAEQFWKKWCIANSAKPLRRLNLSLAQDVYEYCYVDRENK